MFVTIGTVEIMRWVLSRGWKIRMPDSVPENVSRSFEALIPGLFVFAIFDVIRFIFTVIPFDSAQAFIFKFLQTPLTSLEASYPATLVIEVFATILFSFGLHGPNIIGGVMNPIWLSLTAQNAAAYAAGKALPNIVNGQFDANYVKLGGCGCTIGLAIIAAFMAKSDQYKTLGRLGIVPGFFNINEPLIFGIPIVLNPIMMIPFILSPVIFVSLSYFVMKIGLVPIANEVNIPWTTPPIIAGFLISGWKGALFQLVEIVVSMAWWYPFFKIVDKQALEQEQKQA
jgi:PTS system cellobiose-specific IIC component